MKYNYSKLQGRVIEKCGTQARFAERMHWSERTASAKLQQKVPFKQNEIDRALGVLDLSTNDIPIYFFDYQVQNI